MKIRRIICLLMAVLTMTSCLIASAEQDPGISVHMDQCPWCEIGVLSYAYDDYSTWVDVGYHTCTHGGAIKYNDKDQKCKVWRVFTCSNKNCQYTETTGPSTKTRVYCNYKDKYFY